MVFFSSFFHSFLGIQEQVNNMNPAIWKDKTLGSTVVQWYSMDFQDQHLGSKHGSTTCHICGSWESKPLHLEVIKNIYNRVLQRLNKITEVNCLAKCLAHSRCSELALLPLTQRVLCRQWKVLKMWSSAQQQQHHLETCWIPTPHPKLPELELWEWNSATCAKQAFPVSLIPAKVWRTLL
jgi:hypothetical protein